MKLNTMRCKTCHGEMALHTLDAMAGDEHGLRVEIEGMPAMRCSNGHKRLAAPDFAVNLMQALLSQGKLAQLDAASQKGLFRKRYCCPGCGEVVNGGGENRVKAERVLQLSGFEAFRVQVELPTLHCSACGRESMPPERVVTDDLMKASANAFRSAEVEPA